MIKLVAIDLDGTLLNKLHRSDEIIDNTVSRIVQSNSEFAVVTGRHMHANHRIGLTFFKHSFYQIYLNGAITLDKSNQVIDKQVLDKDFVEKTCEQFKHLPIELVTVDGRVYAIENTTVRKGYNGLVQDSDSTWYYVTDGFVDRSYSELTYYNGTWYYVQDGQIDWSYEGIEYYNGKYYYIKNTQITWGMNGSVFLDGKEYVLNNTVVTNMN